MCEEFQTQHTPLPLTLSSVYLSFSFLFPSCLHPVVFRHLSVSLLLPVCVSLTNCSLSVTHFPPSSQFLSSIFVSLQNSARVTSFLIPLLSMGGSLHVCVCGNNIYAAWMFAWMQNMKESNMRLSFLSLSFEANLNTAVIIASSCLL